MAIRVPKYLTDLRGAIGGPAAGAIRGFWFGPDAPPDASWIWIVTSAPVGPVSIVATATLLGIAAPSPLVQPLDAAQQIVAQASLLGLVAADPSVVALAPDAPLALTASPALLGMLAGAPAVEALTGGGAALIPAPYPASFGTTPADGAWWKETLVFDGDWGYAVGGVATVERVATPAFMSNPPASVSRLYSLAKYYNDGTEIDHGRATSWLKYRFPRASVDATSAVLTFKVATSYLIADSEKTRGGLFVWAYDSGGALITAEGTSNVVALFRADTGSGRLILGASGDAANMQYVRSFNLKTFVEGMFVAGKSWTDVAGVVIGFRQHADSVYVNADSLITRWVGDFS